MLSAIALDMVQPTNHAARGIIAACFAIVFLFFGTTFAKAPEKNLITSTDLMRFASIGDPGSVSWNDTAFSKLYALSPDGAQYAVVVRQGDLRKHANAARLLLFKASELFSGRPPTVLASFSSLTNHQPIALVRWLADSKHLTFVGTNGNIVSQVYIADTDTGSVIKATRNVQELGYYDTTPTGSTIVSILAVPKGALIAQPQCIESGCRIESSSLLPTILPQDDKIDDTATDYGLTAIQVQRLNATGVLMFPDRNPNADGVENKFCYSSYNGFVGGVSPDGRYAIRLCTVKNWPTWWKEYNVDLEFQKAIQNSESFFAYQLRLVDLKDGSTRALLQSPVTIFRTRADPVWIDSGRSVILAGALEPLPDTSVRERARRASTWEIIAVDPQTRQLVRISDVPKQLRVISNVSWDQNSGTLVISGQDGGQKSIYFAYRRTGAFWKDLGQIPDPATSAKQRFQLYLSETVNSRPTLQVMDTLTRRKATLLDPNTWLDLFSIGRVDEIAWKTSDGRSWKGGLYYPPNFISGRRYPLAIQTHGFESGHFSLWGISRNFAAQAIAARGILVLQMNEGSPSIEDTPSEWPGEQLGIEAAIDKLYDLGLVNRRKIGIAAWSRTGSQVGYFLTHSDYPIAAAVFGETADYGWWTNMWTGEKYSDRDYGRPPFGKGLANWLETIASFNLDRLQTPMMMWDHSPVDLWDWWTLLHRLNKPVEYWTLPHAKHELFLISERELANALLVDWFDFWLNGHEDPAREKADQYARWHDLKRLQQNSLLKPRPPLLSWKATSRR